MDYLLDTSITRPLFENVERVVRRFAQTRLTDRVYTSVVTEGELLFGVARLTGRRRQTLVRQVGEFLDTVAGVIPITRAVAKTYADIRRNLELSGRPIPANDLWIAAVAAAGSLTLVAHDRDFHSVGGLRVEDWLEEA